LSWASDLAAARAHADELVRIHETNRQQFDALVALYVTADQAMTSKQMQIAAMSKALRDHMVAVQGRWGAWIARLKMIHEREAAAVRGIEAAKQRLSECFSAVRNEKEVLAARLDRVEKDFSTYRTRAAATHDVLRAQIAAMARV
jgi:hypothetical protein